ncbi:MAG: hypothetical protein LBG27_05345 [Spirochaetaceae bacterium]|nr:hypothetical protein [Spirochaetaceae bacterium]
MDGAPNGSPLITVGNGVILTLRNITFAGLSTAKGSASDNYAPVISVRGGGHLILETGASIKDNALNYSDSGGGVYVHGGKFTMNGGEISGNTTVYGGGMYVGNSAGDASVGSTFIMTGGTIRNNTAIGGGSVAVYEGIFTMEGGTISGNTASGGFPTYGFLGGGGGGVALFNTTFSTNGGALFKTGGVIYGADGGDNSNTAATVENQNRVFVLGHAAYVIGKELKRDVTAETGDVLYDPSGIKVNTGLESLSSE